ncbi:MAG TPA: TonB-dependent receptor, partial [Bacteroidota bacterium]|nr:TonB-dependent receptor [Bacteroidota bacterium]
MKYPIATVLAFTITSLASAQSSQGTLKLKIADAEPVLERVLNVHLVEQGTQTIVQSVESEPNNQIILRDIPFGSYEIVVMADSLVLADQYIEVNSTIPVTIELSRLKEYRLGEVTVAGPVFAGTGRATTPATLYTASVIDRLPDASPDKKIEALLLNTAGVVPDEDGRMHVRGEHAQLQYVIDGIPITADLSRVYSSLFNPAMARAISVQTGSLDPEYGVATSGVLSVTSKSGFEKPLFGSGSVDAGSYGGRGMTLEVGGNMEHRNAFYATANLNSSDRYLDPVSGFAPIHDKGQSASAFGKFNSVVSESMDFNALGMYNSTTYQVPNGSDTSLQDQRQSLHDFLVGARLNIQVRDESMLSALVYARSGSASITSGGLDRISGTADSLLAIRQNEQFFIGGRRTESQYGARLEYSARTEISGITHEFKAGIAGEVDPLREFFSFAVTNPALSDTALPGGDLRYRAIDITQGGQPFLVDQSKTASRSSAFVQDNLAFGKWRMGVGGRYDIFTLFESESYFSPRINAAYAYNDNLVLRASYNRIVMQAPLENILVSSSDEARTLAGQDQGSTPTRVTSERSHVFEIGAAYRMNEFLDFDLSGYSKFIDDFLVNVELGTSGVIFPVNLKQGFVAGGELRVSLREWNDLSGSLSFSTCLSEGLKPDDGSSPIDAGLIMGEEGRSYSHPFAGESSFFTEHNQLFTAVLNLSYRATPWLAVNFGGRFDSGLPFDLADRNGVGLDEAASKTELERRGYSESVLRLLSLTSDQPGSPDKAVAPHAVFNLGLSADLQPFLQLPLRAS